MPVPDWESLSGYLNQAMSAGVDGCPFSLVLRKYRKGSIVLLNHMIEDGKHCPHAAIGLTDVSSHSAIGQCAFCQSEDQWFNVTN